MNKKLFNIIILLLVFSFVFSGCVLVSKKVEENPPIKPEPIGKETKIEQDIEKKAEIGENVETKKKEEIFKAKEEIMAARKDLDQEVRERRGEVQLQEKRLIQKEENLENRINL